jgi:hypothetical protein
MREFESMDLVTILNKKIKTKVVVFYFSYKF